MNDFALFIGIGTIVAATVQSSKRTGRQWAIVQLVVRRKNRRNEFEQIPVEVRMFNLRQQDVDQLRINNRLAVIGRLGSAAPQDESAERTTCCVLAEHWFCPIPGNVAAGAAAPPSSVESAPDDVPF